MDLSNNEFRGSWSPTFNNNLIVARFDKTWNIGEIPDQWLVRMMETRGINQSRILNMMRRGKRNQ